MQPVHRETPPSLSATPRSGYTWVSDIAKGGLGTVSLVLRRDGSFQRLYALKRLHAHLRDEPEVRAMFMEEARVAGLLRHPNVVGVLDVGEDDEGPFLVMEYVDGVSLATAIATLKRRGELFPIPILVEVIRQTTEGLGAAHDLRADDGTPCPIVHRDVSPQNILLGFDGIVRMTDFGIAKAIGSEGHTTTHAIKGKCGYLSPEQLRFSRLDLRADLFSLGVVMWELAASKRLFPGNNIEVTAQRILNDPPPELLPERGDAPAELERILFRLLAKDREQRTPSAGALLSELSDLARSISVDEEEADLRAFMTRRFGDVQLAAAADRNVAVRRAGEKLDAREAPARVASASAASETSETSRSVVAASDASDVGPVFVRADAREPSRSAPRRTSLLIAVAVLVGVLVGASALFAAQRFDQPDVVATPPDVSTPPSELTDDEAVADVSDALPPKPRDPRESQAPAMEDSTASMEAVSVTARPPARVRRAHTKVRMTSRATRPPVAMQAGMQPINDWWE